MREIRIQCPGSCGEFLQGWLDGSEKLISYAIDCFSEITLKTIPSPDGHLAFQQRHPRAWQMALQVVSKEGLQPQVLEEISLHMVSDLPRGKGMASSTADLAVTAVAVAQWLGRSLTPEELAVFCTSLEPTDSTLYKELVLMDPLTGIVNRTYGQPPSMAVLVLEGMETIDTKTFRRQDHHLRRQAFKKEMEEALRYFEEGIRQQNFRLLADACFQSAQAQQYFYPHPALETLHQLALDYGAWGINVAHSGSSLGVLHDPQRFQLDAFLQEWHRCPTSSRYFPPCRYQIIPGGVRNLTMG